MRPPRRTLLTALPLAALLALTGCSGDAEPAAVAEQVPEQAAEPSPSVGQRIAETVEAELDGVPLVLEVADEPAERAVGLMGRTEVPAGTGMVFRFDEPVSAEFYMFQVPVPLVAVFVREGTVVGLEQMPPCELPEPGDCPTFGPDAPYDTVVETAPETLPDVAVGDALVLAET